MIIGNYLFFGVGNTVKNGKHDSGRYLNTHVHSCTIHNSQKVEATPKVHQGMNG